MNTNSVNKNYNVHNTSHTINNNNAFISYPPNEKVNIKNKEDDEKKTKEKINVIWLFPFFPNNP